jgi:hypothetical protein
MLAAAANKRIFDFRKVREVIQDLRSAGIGFAKKVWSLPESAQRTIENSPAL